MHRFYYRITARESSNTFDATVFYYGFEEDPRQPSTQRILDQLCKRLNNSTDSPRELFGMPKQGDYQVFGEGSLSDSGQLIIVNAEIKELK